MQSTNGGAAALATAVPVVGLVVLQQLRTRRVRPVGSLLIPAVFAALRAHGRALAVFTGASSRAARMLLKSAGLPAEVLIGGDRVSRPKPTPHGILLAAGELGIDPVDVAYVGDSPLDLCAAMAAGSRGAAAAWGHMYDPAERADAVLSAPLQALGLLSV